MEELISIIIPVYNVEKYIEECIKSVINQTYKKLEIILVDDGSTDNSGKICDEYSKKDDRIIVVHKKNGGVSDARNYGIEVAKGKYISFIDSDDYIEKDMYEFLYNLIKNEDAQISCCGKYIVYDNKTELYVKKDVKEVMNSQQAILMLCNFGYMGHSTYAKLYKKELFKEIKYPKIKNGEDIGTTYKVFDNANKIVYDSTPKYYYRQRADSITKQKKTNDEIINVSKEFMEFVIKKYPEIEKPAICYYVYTMIGFYDSIIKSENQNKKQAKDILKEIRKYSKQCKNEMKIQGRKRYLQSILIIHFPKIYNIIFKIYNMEKYLRKKVS